MDNPSMYRPITLNGGNGCISEDDIFDWAYLQLVVRQGDGAAVVEGLCRIHAPISTKHETCTGSVSDAIGALGAQRLDMRSDENEDQPPSSGLSAELSNKSNRNEGG
jgi:hypothetical protein